MASYVAFCFIIVERRQARLRNEERTSPLLPNPIVQNDTLTTARFDFRVVGMDCADEIAVIRSALNGFAGIDRLDFDVLNQRLTVTAASTTDASMIAKAIAQTGMQADPWRDSVPGTQMAEENRIGRTTATMLSGFFLLAGFFTSIALAGWTEAFGHTTTSWPIRILYLAAAVAGAWNVLPKALYSARHLRPDMNLLMTVAVAGAVGVGQYFEAGTVAFLFAVSLALEAWSVGRARRAISALLALTPPKALVRSDDGREQLNDIADVAVGATVVVKPGEKFPLDGRITKGQTTVNQAPITGESVPVSKETGAEIFAGTINEAGAVEFVTTKLAQDTTLARIIRAVGEAQRKRAPSEQWVERFAKVYTPAVLILATLVAVFPPLMGGSWSKWFYEALVLLVIACPCALVISTPVSIVAAMTAAARHGVLIKGGVYVELPSRVRAIALDKTGTLTVGRPEVQEVIPLYGHDDSELLQIASAVEKRSEHPLGRAIVRFAATKNIDPPAAEDFQAIKGKGATARIDGRPMWIGSHRLLEERGQETTEHHDQIRALEERGLSLVVVGEDHHVCGFIAVGDQVRENAPAVVATLHSMGVKTVIILTGDNQATARAVGKHVGADEVRAELLPEDKVAAIEELVKRHGVVAMVGDGVNDAPAMARSSLGIAMGAAGTDAAIETADIALMNDDLSRLPWLIGHSRRAVRTIQTNITMSLIVKAAFIILTLFGRASLWTAILADTGVSLVVVANALRLLRTEPEE
jgi:Cd2+/Zn2+-exporting ATPase